MARREVTVGHGGERAGGSSRIQVLAWARAKPANGCRSRAIAAIASVCLCLSPLGLSGCTVYKAAAAPSLKDLTVLKPGTARARVIAELGHPVRTESLGDSRKDVFTFIQGYSRARRSSLATVIALEDIATLGIAEISFEGFGEDNAGKKMTVAVYYDASDVVTKSETILVTPP